MSSQLNASKKRNSSLPTMRAHQHVGLGVKVLLSFSLVFLGIYAMTLGDMHLSYREVYSALLGQGSQAHQMVVWEWRAPRVLAALALGAALAVSGTIFQGVTRNPLGSPDIVGFTTGSMTGVVMANVLGLNTFWGSSASALIGGLVTASFVCLLTYRGGLQSFQFIVVGLAVSAFLTSINTWFMTFFDLAATFEVSIWGAGSLAFVSWKSVLPAAVIGIFLIVITFPVMRVMRQMELGDDFAAASGVPVHRARLALIALGIVLTAVVTAVAGPILFIALVAPHIALRLIPTSGLSLTVVALVGALLLLISDILAQHLIPGVVLPTGSVTVILGGGYLAWLLYRTSR
ncbi:MAG: iron chelate uptake ABC transporter family permease subunit [Rothia sp. (in: high G+C Gram-positive bacteria)]|uniref:FecCD family ABC transporter permease n=1 Tax=Rothia sp. (in: high G+C Gram-positive bacteria) TaxID=1885016 RepID=UPI00270847B6|nr:iron chelate uptake ABC transporter family permease subunit [Rothia sp. (in: high G+C Gram-positive bacteria)]